MMTVTMEPIEEETSPEHTVFMDPDMTGKTQVEPHNGLDILGRGTKELLQLINKLEQLGLETKDVLSLPKIVALGDQSAGKSSNIEAISGIKLPKSSGTCTRCPLQITLTDSPKAPWTCAVYIVKKYELSKRTTPSQKDLDNPFAPWVPKLEPDRILFKTVNIKGELEDMIRRAQVAILNPSRNPAYFITCSMLDIENCRLSIDFSPNLIWLEISAPGLPNLAFYDLPGVINQQEKTNEVNMVKIVKSIAREYIAQERTLIMLACSLETDMNNSSASKLVRKANAADRCIGVLTKPDRLVSTQGGGVLRQILENKLYTLGHGYYVTKQPSDDELLEQNEDPRRTRAAEEHFFLSREPWASLPEHLRNQFGTTKLQQALSDKLAIHILNSLPSMKEQINQRIEWNAKSLRSLPDPPTSNALTVIFTVISRFIADVQRQMEGGHPHNEWRLKWNELREQFRGELETSLKPKINLKASEHDEIIDGIPEAFPEAVISLDSDVETPASTPSGSKRKRQETSEPTSRTTPSKSSRHSRSSLVIRSKQGKTFTLDEIRSTLNNISTSHIPGEGDPKALETLIQECLEPWLGPAGVFVQKVGKNLKARLHTLFDDRFCDWKNTEFAKQAWTVIETFLDIQVPAQLENTVKRGFRLETYKPFCENFEIWDHNRSKALKDIREKRRKTRLDLYFDKLTEVQQKTITPAMREQKTKSELIRNALARDPYEREICTMAKINGYYDIAAPRYYEHICMGLQAELFGRLRENTLESELITSLRIDENAPDAQETAMKLLAEDPEREIERLHLKKERDTLVQARDALNEMDLKYQQLIENEGTEATYSVGDHESDFM